MTRRRLHSVPKVTRRLLLRLASFGAAVSAWRVPPARPAATIVGHGGWVLRSSDLDVDDRA